MRRKSIIAIIITYNPDEILLEENLLSFYYEVNKVIIWDNTPEGSPAALRVSTKYEKTVYMTEKKNEGISYVLNKAWNIASSNGFDYLLTMDQDSVWVDFRQYLRYINIENAPLGIYGPEVSEKNKNTCVFKQVDYVITSGMLVSTSILNRLKGYRTDFFVDGIDIEFCLRAKQIGIQTFQICQSMLKHRFGTPTTISFLGHLNHMKNYPPERIKEILKTHVILLFQYPCSFQLRKKIVVNYFWKLPQKILLLENDKIKKMKAYCLGIHEGISNIRNNEKLIAFIGSLVFCFTYITYPFI